MKENQVIIKAEHLKRTYRIMENSGGFLTHFFSNRYKEIAAVDDISFEIKRGEIVGFIGPNGAGKSTTIKMMTGILVPTGGKVEVFGKEPYKHRKENAFHMGVVFGQRSQLWWDLPLSDTFQLLKKMYRISDEVYHQNMRIFMDRLDLKNFFGQPVRRLSLGQRMRGEIAAAMLHNPEVLFLDEPTIGLDIVAKQQMRDFIQTINRERGVTIVLTTHDMKDVEDLCQNILLINHGKLVLNMPIAEVKHRFGKTHDVVIAFAEPPTGVIEINGCKGFPKNSSEYVFRIENDKISVSEFISACVSQLRIQDISVQGTDIEEIIRQMY